MAQNDHAVISTWQ